MDNKNPPPQGDDRGRKRSRRTGSGRKPSANSDRPTSDGHDGSYAEPPKRPTSSKDDASPIPATERPSGSSRRPIPVTPGQPVAPSTGSAKKTSGASAKARVGKSLKKSNIANQPAANQPDANSSRKKPVQSGGTASGEREKPSRQPKSARPIAVKNAKQQVAPDEVDEPEDLEQKLLDTVKRGAPSWLVSLIVHLVLIIVLALLTLRPQLTQTLDLNAIFAEEIGEQLEDTTFDLDSLIDFEADESEYSEDNIPVEDPFSAMPELITAFEGSIPTSDVQAPVIGNALDGREEGMKKILLEEYGGNESTEEAVRRALLWLKKNQRRDGTWSLTEPYSDGVFLENVSAATAMALLAFQGAGNTHESGEFRDTVARGWQALLKRQGGDGDFYQADGSQGVIPAHHLYTHAQATIAICELYAMTKDETLREPAERALKYAESAQSSRGGWRYSPADNDADLSVTGWFVMAFQSALMAGLPVNPDVLEHTKEFLRTCDADDGIRFIYKRGHDPSPDMTAEAMLCWEYLGWTKDNERLNTAARYLLRHPVKWEEKNVYYWYYATQALHHLEGELWNEWNREMRQVIPSNQERSGRETGSWDPTNDPEGVHGGRLYTTCMCVFMLEVYYRHLPIYRYRLR